MINEFTEEEKNGKACQECQCKTCITKDCGLKCSANIPCPAPTVKCAIFQGTDCQDFKSPEV